MRAATTVLVCLVPAVSDPGPTRTHVSSHLTHEREELKNWTDRVYHRLDEDSVPLLCNQKPFFPGESMYHSPPSCASFLFPSAPVLLSSPPGATPPSPPPPPTLASRLTPLTIAGVGFGGRCDSAVASSPSSFGRPPFAADSFAEDWNT